MTTTAYSQVTIANLGSCVRNGQTIPAGPWLVYGNITGDCNNFTGNPVGMKFNSPTGYSNTSGGNFVPVQLISSFVITGSASGSATAGLDQIYPYDTSLPTNDSPKIRLLSSYTTISGSFNATMFLMWQSTTSNSIPVPLGYQTWAFSGTANCSSSCGSASNWTATTSGTPGNVGNWVVSNANQTSVGNNVLVFGYPTWTGASHF